MSPKGNLLNFFRQNEKDEPEEDVQAGLHSLSPAETARRYLKHPGHYLAILRFYSKESVDQVADAVGLHTETVAAYEKGEQTPSLPDLTKLAKHYKADLRILLDAFGHIASGAAEESMGIAAQFSGELSDDEKVNLKRLVKAYGKAGKE